MLHLVYRAYITQTYLTYLGLNLQPGFYQLNLVVGVSGTINRLDYKTSSFPLEYFLDSLSQCYLHTDVNTITGYTQMTHVNTITGYTQMTPLWEELLQEALLSPPQRLPFNHSVVDLVNLTA